MYLLSILNKEKKLLKKTNLFYNRFWKITEEIYMKIP